MDSLKNKNNKNMNKKNNSISTLKKNLQRQASLKHALEKIDLNPATNHQLDIKNLACNYFLQMKNDEEIIFFIENYNFDSFFSYIYSDKKRISDKHSAEKSLYFILYFMEFSFTFHDEISLTNKLLGESVTVKKINFIELLKMVLELFYNFIGAINSIKSSVVYNDRFLIKINSNKNKKVIKNFYHNLQNINNKKDIILKNIFVKDWKACLNIFFMIEEKKGIKRKLESNLEKQLIKKSKKTQPQTKDKFLLQENHRINSGSAANSLATYCIKNSPVNTDYYKKDSFFWGKSDRAANHDDESINYSRVPVYENDSHALNDARIDPSSHYDSGTEDHDYESIDYSSFPIYENDFHASNDKYELINNKMKSDYCINENSVKKIPLSEPPLSEQLKESLLQWKQGNDSHYSPPKLSPPHVEVNSEDIDSPPSSPPVPIPGLNLKNQSYTLFSEKKNRLSQQKNEMKLNNEQTESKNFE